MNCKPSFSPPWTLDGTDSPSAIETEPGRCISQPQPLQDVGDSPTDPVVQVLQTRFLRAWQKMLDEGVDWFQTQGERDAKGGA
jgi:hypothetical protein